ncbi:MULTISPECIES: flagellar biosynthetic protein FliR [unclassified Colwellia]|uniref:flagellar biosynthetic protein FliR n=1 Tax=unclassified Colwellia TaxID=196834 RepID=UPI0015F47F21|nr:MULTISPECIES: flagellar biosynthetic protein FliR [unclassified Colwellia]MBA6233429.1 flagellar type III secretion system protein FliR [Colwellia sp. MB02u-7]MBA6236519.1 flagellar type III secretion system protein FliR [Colwellia sp. MB02u-11]MBA6257053.1 flagellar type III secretion system protein FliR [Colwellia sp. MB3u-28]MBA6260942.1 flagellar type III secretion system protein FliR [Colwellia sp. MB3u-41]MBA6298082.1 flagellar type III secretion system protein FliR [Colwellia sp. MB3
MEFTESVVMQYIADFILPFSRISALIMSMIGFGSKVIPGKVKVFLCMTLTIAIMPAIPPTQVDSLLSFQTTLLIFEQMVIGIALGLVTVMVLNTFTLAGQIIAMQTGLGFASLVDPVSGMNVPAVGQFFLILSTLMFWAMDGHLAYLHFIVASFDTLPIGEYKFTPDKFKEVVEWGEWMFATALSLALAPLTAMLLINFSFGVMTRAAPQLNIFAIGFPVTMCAGLLIMWLTMGNFFTHYELQWKRALDFSCYLIDCKAN